MAASSTLITATHTIDTVHRAYELGVNASVNGIDFGTLRILACAWSRRWWEDWPGLLAHLCHRVRPVAFHAG